MEGARRGGRAICMRSSTAPLPRRGDSVRGSPCGGPVRLRFTSLRPPSCGCFAADGRRTPQGSENPTDKVHVGGSSSEASAERIARTRRHGWRRQLAEGERSRRCERGPPEPRRSRHRPLRQPRPLTPFARSGYSSCSSARARGSNPRTMIWKTWRTRRDSNPPRRSRHGGDSAWYEGARAFRASFRNVAVLMKWCT
jgi:hypothetical protein